MKNSFNIDARYVESARFFAAEALHILRQACERGTLFFDLDVKEFLSTGQIIPKAVDCQTGSY